MNGSPGGPVGRKHGIGAASRRTKAGMGGKTSLKVDRFAARTCRVTPIPKRPEKIRLMGPFRTPEAGGGPLPAQRCRRPFMQPILTIRDARAPEEFQRVCPMFAWRRHGNPDIGCVEVGRSGSGADACPNHLVHGADSTPAGAFDPIVRARQWRRSEPPCTDGAPAASAAPGGL